MQRLLWAGIRKQKAQWNQIVRAYGLYPRGYEVRGWRAASVLLSKPRIHDGMEWGVRSEMTTG